MYLPWSFCDETAGCQLLRLDEGCLSVPRKKTTAEHLELIIMLVDHLALYTAIDSAVSRHVDLHDLVHLLWMGSLSKLLTQKSFLTAHEAESCFSLALTRAWSGLRCHHRHRCARLQRHQCHGENHWHHPCQVLGQNSIHCF